MNKYWEQAEVVANEINELKRQLKEKEAELKEIDQKLDLKATYEYTVKLVPSDDRFTPMASFTECIRILGKLTNQDMYDKHMGIFGYVYGDWKETRNSVTYYRVGNEIRYEGGGWLILHKDTECSDTEWEEIKKGNIPERLFNIR